MATADVMLFETGSSGQTKVELPLTRDEVARAMGRLTSSQQDVIALRLAGGLSLQETARVLGKADGATKAAQLQALRALRAILVGEG